jgi:hypothetical protein
MLVRMGEVITQKNQLTEVGRYLKIIEAEMDDYVPTAGTEDAMISHIKRPAVHEIALEPLLL